MLAGLKSKNQSRIKRDRMGQKWSRKYSKMKPSSADRTLIEKEKVITRTEEVDDSTCSIPVTTSTGISVIGASEEIKIDEALADDGAKETLSVPPEGSSEENIERGVQARHQMSSSTTTTDRDKCGLGSLLPLSCRGRAEAFARSLHSRLRTLNPQDATETSWLTHDPIQPALSHQPRHSSTSAAADPINGDWGDLGGLESPGSPTDELEENVRLLNNDDNLLMTAHPHDSEDSCRCPTAVTKPQNKTLCNGKSVSHDSDSDCSFYDTENDMAVETSTPVLTNGFHKEDSPSSPDTATDSNDKGCCNGSDVACNGQHKEEECVTQDTDVTDSSTAELQSLSDDTGDEVYTSSLTVDTGLTVELTTSNSNGFNDDDDDSPEPSPPRVRRCSSLKTGKTPPGTPGRNKSVRFADALGLDLADVRTFLDEIPKVPTSAYDDLPNADLSETESEPSNLLRTQLFQAPLASRPDRIVVPLFQQPGGLPNFLDRVREKNVSLENAIVDDPIALSIRGTVRVRNLDFHKSVHIRYSLDSWKTFADVQAVYVPNSCDGFSDTFSFLMYAHTVAVGNRLEFAVRFQCRGCQYWDNNNGANYCFQCLPQTNTSPAYSTAPIAGSGSDDTWGASFYYLQEDSSNNNNNNNDTEEENEKEALHTAVQEFITHSLEAKSKTSKQRSDMFPIIIILIVSFIFVYLQKAIFIS